MECTLCRSDDKLKPGGADRNDPGDGLPAVEHDDGLPTPNGLEVLAQVSLEIGGAYGDHDYMIVMHIHDVNDGDLAGGGVPVFLGSTQGRDRSLIRDV